MLAGVDVAIVGRRGNPELIGLRAGGLHSCTIEVLDQRGIADRFPVRYRTTLSLGPQLLLGDRALDEFGSFFLVGLTALVQEHFAHLRNRPLLVFSDPLDVLPQGLVHSEFGQTPAIRFEINPAAVDLWRREGKRQLIQAAVHATQKKTQINLKTWLRSSKFFREPNQFYWTQI